MTETQGVPPPSDDTSISKSIPSKTSPSPLPSINTLRTWLPLYLKQTDKTISHLNRILSTPSGTDSLLGTIQYLALALSTLLSTLSLRRLHSQLNSLLALARALPPSTTIVLEPPSAPPLLLTSQSLHALSALISDVRIFARLFGLLGIYRWARSLASHPPKDKVLGSIAWAQVGANVAFQALENAAYLASKGVLLGAGWDKRRQARAWVWSSRFWAAHVALEGVRLGYLWERGRRDRGSVRGVEEEDKKEEVVAWRRDAVSNAAYAPLTVHWSTEQGLVGDFWVGILGTVASGVGLAQVWEDTA